jgi:hypothetical protein
MTDKKARVNVDPGLEYPELIIWDLDYPLRFVTDRNTIPLAVDEDGYV